MGSPPPDRLAADAAFKVPPTRVGIDPASNLEDGAERAMGPLGLAHGQVSGHAVRMIHLKEARIRSRSERIFSS